MAMMSRSSGATIKTDPLRIESSAMDATWACAEICGSKARKQTSDWLLDLALFNAVGAKALSTAATLGGIALLITSHGFVAHLWAV